MTQSDLFLSVILLLSEKLQLVSGTGARDMYLKVLTETRHKIIEYLEENAGLNFILVVENHEHFIQQ